MTARLLDGKSARHVAVDVAVIGGDLVAVADGAERLRWPAARIRADGLPDGQVRLSVPKDDARLIMDEDAWRELGGGLARRSSSHRRARAWSLYLGLTALGASLVALVLVGIPAAARPLARLTPPGLEARFGRMMELQLTAAMKPCGNDPGQAVLSGLGAKVAGDAELGFPLRVRAVRAPFANAMTLPGGIILVTDDLIDDAETSDELAGVLAHEIAHIELHHVMEGAWRSMGIGLLLDAIVGGGSGLGQQGVIIAGQVTELKFGRDAERAADARAVGLLTAANISPNGLRAFFERMAKEDREPSLGAAEEWLSSHPGSQERARLIPRSSGGQPALSAADWATLKGVCKTANAAPRGRARSD